VIDGAEELVALGTLGIITERVPRDVVEENKGDSEE
jgi:hypothetical protein